jgi:uncharacterized membrane protein YqaE (UPF0057 family)
MAENKKIGGKIDQKDCCSIVAAVFLPPLGVYLEQGCGTPCFINIALCFLFWFPGGYRRLSVGFRDCMHGKAAGCDPVDSRLVQGLLALTPSHAAPASCC